MPSCTQLTPAHFFPTSMCTDPKNRAARVFSSANGQDKFLKLCSEGIIPIVSEVAFASGASDETMDTIGKVHSAVRLTRDVTGFLNVFRGVIPGLYVGGKTICTMVQGIYRGDGRVYFDKPGKGSVDYPNGPDVGGVTTYQIKSIAWTEQSNTRHRIDWPSNVKLVDSDDASISVTPNYVEWTSPAFPHNGYAQGRKEQFLKLGALSFKWLGSAAFAIGFGVSRPVANVRKHFGAKLSPAGNQVADAFPYIICANHVAVVAGESFEIAYQFEAYERTCNAGQWSRKVEKDFKSALTVSVVDLITKSLELIKDSLGFLRLTGPAWLRLPLGLSISGLSFITVCIKTT
ncbi:MAG: hypothetical protein S4CHLAM2_12530 [Chlamydiales bacterium]|nr:hypothetical protein [Chlamydiales bacterium]